jgi:hypothetical protein
MPYNTSMIAQNLATQTAMMGNQMTYAQQISSGQGGMGGGFMPSYAAPPMIPPGGGGMPGMMPGASGPNFQAGFGQMMMGAMDVGMSTPFTGQGQQAATQMTSGMLGMIASPQTPIMGAMFQGLQEQQMTNTALQQSFNFVGGQGRGFNSNQKSQIGNFMSQTAQSDMFASLPELTRVMQGGAEMGMFSAVRDVQQFKQRFNTMLTSLKDISRTLGTTLEEAQQFTRQMQTMGVFSPDSQVQAAQRLAGQSATSGIGIQQLTQFGAQYGNVMHQATGMDRAGGARAGAGMLSTLGTAQRQGLFGQEEVYAATGQSGLAGLQSFGQNLTQANARFMKRGTGNITLAAFIDPQTGDVDQTRLNMFMSGQIGRQEIGQMAHQNISKMGGRAEWIANKGQYQAKFAEQTNNMGPLALMMGVMPEDLKADPQKAKIWLQRRTGMSAADLDIAMPMIQNYQSMMKSQENDQEVAARQQQYRTWAQEHGPAGVAKRMQKKMDDMVRGPFRELSKNINDMISAEVESIIDETYGVHSEYLSQATANRYTRELRTGTPSAATGTFRKLGKQFAGADMQAEQMGAGASFKEFGGRKRAALAEGRFGEALGHMRTQYTQGIPELLQPLFGGGARGLEKLLGGQGWDTLSDTEQKMVMGTASGKELGFGSDAKFTTLAQDAEVASLIAKGFDPKGSGKASLDGAVDELVRSGKVENEDQARALVYKATKENKTLKEIKDNMGISLPNEGMTGDTQNATESLNRSMGFYRKAAVEAGLGKGGAKTLRSAMQDETTRNAMANYYNAKESEKTEAWNNVTAAVSKVDKDLGQKMASMSSEGKKALIGALAYGERAQSQQHAQQVFDDMLGEIEGKDDAAFGKGGDLVRGMRQAFEDSESTQGAVAGAEGKIMDFLDGISSERELKQVVSDLRSSGATDLADTIEARGSDLQTLKKWGKQGARGQQKLKTRALKDIVGKHLSAEARGKLDTQIGKKGGLKDVSKEYLMSLGKDLEGSQKKQFEQDVMRYGDLVADQKISGEEVLQVAKAGDVLGEYVSAKGESKAGGAMQPIVDALVGDANSLGARIDNTNKLLEEGKRANTVMPLQIGNVIGDKLKGLLPGGDD